MRRTRKPRGARDLDDAGKSEVRHCRLGRGDKRRADRFGNHAACAEQGIRRVSRQPGIACALHHHVGQTIEGLDRLRGHQLAAENEALGLPAGIAHDVVADTTGDAEMELIDRAPQQILIRHVLAADRAASGWSGLDPHPRGQRQWRAASRNRRIEPHRLCGAGFQRNPDDAAGRAAATFARRDRRRAVARDFQHVPTRVCPGDQAPELPDPGRDRIERRNVGPRHQPRFGAGASDRKNLDLEAGCVETILQIENDLAALDPEQMVPGAGHTAFHETDGEDIDMPRRDLERMPTMVEKFRVTAIERDMARRPTGAFVLLQQGFGHSCATSLA